MRTCEASFSVSTEAVAITSNLRHEIQVQLPTTLDPTSVFNIMEGTGNTHLWKSWEGRLRRVDSISSRRPFFLFRVWQVTDLMYGWISSLGYERHDTPDNFKLKTPEIACVKLYIYIYIYWTRAQVVGNGFCSSVVEHWSSNPEDAGLIPSRKALELHFSQLVPVWVL